ncbi:MULTISPECIES: hypothetical protein [Actinosynnema]|uniref:protein-L-isoaspartate O-methyltransferase family protein n=1 Tax=Actinosynnema TaxID=40566 RepID=UPI0020A293F9|nr:hypothetical protein [Actinosynnema pretiosum]MCP2100006.1 protein-L-isoaspartate(D-aspartate) O-methyltransferase [Actinosynnema pretiosum]
MTAADLAITVPEQLYAHHSGRGSTPMRSNPEVVHRDLDSLRVRPGMAALEIGTGSGYSGGMLAALVGAEGRVTSIDIDPYLTRWAQVIHYELGVDTVRCLPGDGMAGHQQSAPYDRIVAWCTPPCLPAAWVDQLAQDGLLVTPLPITALPHITVVATLGLEQGHPTVLAVREGGYMETSSAPCDTDTPTRWVDWEYRSGTDTSWISVAWRKNDDPLHTGARAALDLLLTARHTGHHHIAPEDWTSWRTWAAATQDVNLTIANTGTYDAIGHSTPASVAVLRQDGTILADSADSASLAVLREWLRGWEHAECPAVDAYRADLSKASTSEPRGWGLRLTWQPDNLG